MLVALRSLCHSSVELAEAMFVELIGLSWASMPSDECRVALIPSMEALLARPYNRQQLNFTRKPGGSGEGGGGGGRRRNVVGGMLRAFLEVTPTPNLNVNLLAR